MVGRFGQLTYGGPVGRWGDRSSQVGGYGYNPQRTRYGSRYWAYSYPHMFAGVPAYGRPYGRSYGGFWDVVGDAAIIGAGLALAPFTLISPVLAIAEVNRRVKSRKSTATTESRLAILEQQKADKGKPGTPHERGELSPKELAALEAGALTPDEIAKLEAQGIMVPGATRQTPPSGEPKAAALPLGWLAVGGLVLGGVILLAVLLGRKQGPRRSF